VRQDRNRFHSKLQPLIQVLAVQHATPHVMLYAGYVGLVETVVPTVTVPASLPVLFIALVIRLLTRGTPEQSALVRVCATCSLEAERLPNLARNAVNLENIFWAELRGSRAVLWQVTLVFREPAHCSGQFWFAGLEVATFSRSTGGVRKEFTRVRIAARIVAMLLQSAVTFLARLHEPVTTHGGVEQGPWFVSQAIIHPMFEGQGQVLKAARRPKRRLHGGGCRSHNTSLVGTLTILRVMFHTKIMTQFMSHCCGDKANHFTVPHTHTP